MDKQSSQIRTEFLEFFRGKKCTIVPSDSLVPAGDRTLLFTSAGMVQFKRHFLGQSGDSFTRAASCQKCLRTSDIEQVGATARHLTFFEMLGNFSFGDYFKEEAVAWAWEFLTKNMSLPANRLYATVYKDDDETAEIWSKIVPAGRIIRMGEETNFWNMGTTGPCGPCSEILIDLENGADCDRYLEIWNLVFTQFDREKDGSLRNLPKKNIDTGMGLERLVAVSGGKKNVFATDLFAPLMESAAEILKIKNEGAAAPKLAVIADHSRAAAFLISDGVLPSNEGRGYVLRRILRRALRQGKLCGYERPFINELVSEVFKIMERPYPELSSKLDSVRSIIRVEEEKFLETLESGSAALSSLINSCRSRGVNIIDGRDVFKLYDTYGFPYDLTKEIASENGLAVDEDGLKTEQKAAQERSRVAWSGSGERDATFYSVLRKRIGDTLFSGYDNGADEGEVLALVKNGTETGELKAGEEGEIVLSNTSFYAQSGGQNADRGKIANACFECSVENVFKPAGNLFVHKVRVLKGRIRTGERVSTLVDDEYRKQVSRHHTATHLLHRVLREMLGGHITQAGSLVADNYLRFDFTHFSAVEKDALIKIERRVNFIIRSNLDVRTETMGIEGARKAGATALFGEKYGETVRTVSVINEDGDGSYSMELCGGTHTGRTGEIGIFKIVSESSVAAGVRRIEAVAGVAAENYILDEEAAIAETLKILNASSRDLADKARRYAADYKKIESELKSLKSVLILNEIDSCVRNVRKVNGINFLPVLVGSADIETLRVASDRVKEKLKSIVLLIASKDGDKTRFIVSVTADNVRRGVDADKIARSFAAAIKGSGGGRPEFAQGGSKDSSCLDLGEVVKSSQRYIIAGAERQQS
jgi:alanyl-tRNA synthetase